MRTRSAVALASWASLLARFAFAPFTIFSLIAASPVKAGFAFKVLDARTGELLRAGAEKRVGGKSISGSTDKWSDVNNALQYWAELSSYRMCQETGRSGCEAPDVPKGF